MLPPCSPEVAVEIAWPIEGATPRQPIIGAMGRVSPCPDGASCSVTVPALPSMVQVARVLGGSFATNSGSTTFSASAARVQPVARMGCIARISTRRLSPGSAPATAMGPFIGLGLRMTFWPCLSQPLASIVSVVTVSPLATVRAGGRVARTL